MFVPRDTFDLVWGLTFGPRGHRAGQLVQVPDVDLGLTRAGRQKVTLERIEVQGAHGAWRESNKVRKTNSLNLNKIFSHLRFL